MQITAVTALLLFNMEIKVKIDENTIAVISTVTANNKTIFILSQNLTTSSQFFYPCE